MFKILAFLVLVAVTVGFFTMTVAKLVRIAALGKPANLQETWGERVASLMTFFFGQRKVVEEKRSWHHLPIYWGFLVLQVGLIDMLITGLFGQFGFTLADLLGHAGHAWLVFVVDWGNAIVLSALLYAFWRRLVVRPAFVPMSLDAMLILGAITLLVLSHFGMHACEIAVAGAYVHGTTIDVAGGR